MLRPVLEYLTGPYFIWVELVWVPAVITWILLERRPPTSTLAWIFALIFLPWVGVFVYFFFGPRRLRKRRYDHEKARKLTALARSKDETDEAFATRSATSSIAQLGERAGGLPPMCCDSATLLYDGADTYDAILEAIRGARHHVHLEYYIFADGKTATAIRDALTERARAGVEVRLLVDHLGSYGTKQSFFAPLVAAGGRVARFGRTATSFLGLRLANFRTHRKIVVVDGTVGFVGGLNIDDVHDARIVGESAWRDTCVRIEGDAVRGLQATFAQNWRYAAHESFSGKHYFPAPNKAGELVVQIVAGAPDDVFALHKLHLAAISGAHQRILLTTPYFLPDDALRDALVVAAMRGVDVHVLVPVDCDNAIADAAMRTYYDDLVPMGVVIHEYEPRMLHAKTLVIDDCLAIVGTANFDNRSLKLNFEVVAVFHGTPVVDALAARFALDLSQSRLVTRRELAMNPWYRRLAEAAARLLSPLM